MTIDMDQIQGLVAALAGKRSLASPVPMEDVFGLLDALANITPNLSRAAIQGLYIANTPGQTATHISISEGQARSSDNSADIVLPAGLTKSLAAPWAAGTGNGMRSSAAAIVANSYYHLFAIFNPSTGAVDIIADQSPINPNMVLASGFTKRRRIGCILTDASGNIWQFRQKPDRTIFKLPRSTEFVNLTTQNTLGTLRQFHLPRGIKVRPLIVLQSTGSNVGGWWSGIYDPDDGPPPTFGVTTQWAHIRRVSAIIGTAGQYNQYGMEIVSDVWTDVNAQLYSAGNDSGDTFAMGSLGWFDPLEWGY